MREYKQESWVNEAIHTCRDITCGIFEHHLSLLDLQGNEIMFLIEASVVEEKTTVLQGGKTTRMIHKDIQSVPQTMTIQFYDQPLDLGFLVGQAGI